MQPATDQQAAPAEGVMTEASLKRTALSWATNFLNRQDTLTVVMILYGTVVLIGLVFLYRDMQAANQAALEKQEKARAEYREELATERARSDVHTEKAAASIEKFGDRVAGSLDRLTDEIRRRPLSAN